MRSFVKVSVMSLGDTRASRCNTTQERGRVRCKVWKLFQFFQSGRWTQTFDATGTNQSTRKSRPSFAAVTALIHVC